MLRLLTLALCLAAALAHPEKGKISPELTEPWETFKSFYKKEYDGQFEYIRRLIWEDNLKYIQKHNLQFDLGKHTYSLGINEFGDLTNEEYKAYYLGFKMSSANNQTKASHYLHSLRSKVNPEQVDWRSKGYVTPVKNQGQCGSCWAFSATGSLEGQHFRKTGKLVSMSEQQLVDCSRNYGNNGCEGGLMDNAFKYIKENGGIDGENAYPYTAQDGQCKFDRSNVVATDTGLIDIPQGNEEMLKDATANVGPISVAIDASHRSFQFYRTGVYNEQMCSQVKLDHGVLVVGYGTYNDQDYWLVKNSWGPRWGLQGYLMMSRNKNNQCGIATKASYPLV